MAREVTCYATRVWLELIQGPGARAPRHFTKATRFPVKIEGHRWSCAVANWSFAGERRDGRWTLEGRHFSRNGDPVPAGTQFEPLDVLMFDDELAVRLHAHVPRAELELPARWWELPEAERLVLADQLLDAGDSLGEWLGTPSPALEARWLALLMLPPRLGTVTATWRGGAIDELEVKLGGSARTLDVTRWVERLPRRLSTSRIGAPVRALRWRAPHFAGSAWAEVIDALARSSGDHPMQHLRRIEVAWGREFVSARQVCWTKSWERLLKTCPSLA
ncbi:MAG: hypothetical protein U0228_18995 [Myxococcaceae bacterium]